MNLINAVEDTLTKKKINFGGKSYTFGGLFGIGNTASKGTTIFDLPKNMVDYVEDTAEETVAGYEGKLTYAQKQSIMRRHGLNPRNYAKIRLVEEQTNALIHDLITTGTNENAVALLENAAANNQAIDALMEAAGESMVAQQQVTTTQLLNVATAITRLEIGLNNFSGMVATQQIKEDYTEELKAQEREQRAMQRENERRKWTVMQDWWEYEKENCVICHSGFSACIPGIFMEPCVNRQGTIQTYGYPFNTGNGLFSKCDVVFLQHCQAHCHRPGACLNPLERL
jgi:hypothetical protein